jgi:hypothetical protein
MYTNCGVMRTPTTKFSSLQIEQRSSYLAAAHQKLVQKMREKVRMDPRKRWIIRDGTIAVSGQWTLSTEKDESKKLYGELEVMHN